MSNYLGAPSERIIRFISSLFAGRGHWEGVISLSSSHSEFAVEHLCPSGLASFQLELLAQTGGSCS